MIKPEDREPELGPFSIYVEAFHEVSSCRQIGFGLGPIPFTAIAEYFTIFPIGEDFEEFLYLMRRMDSALLQIENKKGAASGKGTSGNKDHGRRPRR